ncbi:hypothetical protein [uncultured Sunxiuqinia sp.]|uniref:hypothetical protein n=1 Tax=uncultured Sunxiuqinia sp. TaxID=1573825 RepID=UPI0026114F70|nr:hypothetical protein [uncultured Sunxiuqinia sp.]
MKYILNTVIAFGLFCGSVSFPVLAQNKEPIFSVDTENYFSKHDIVYKTPSYEGFEGFPIGNGDLGGLIWATPNSLCILYSRNADSEP